MRIAVLAAVLSLIAPALLAAPWDSTAPPPPKPARDWPVNVPLPNRQGGDTIASAFTIADLPFTDTGTTTGYTNDYDAVCPFNGSTSPDVVYRYIATADIDLDVDLCGSQYDTKTYVLNADQELLACNDDAYYGPPCGTYVSHVVVSLVAGQLVYIVVDGFGGEHGAYALAVSEGVQCTISQPSWAYPEGEPPLHEGYVDQTNGGCNSIDYGTPMSDVELYFEYSRFGFHGTSGWYSTDGVAHRDTDWIRFISDLMEYSLTLEVESEQPIYVLEVWPQNCDNASVVQQLAVNSCQSATMTISSDNGIVYWIVVAPQSTTQPDGAPQEFQYKIKVLDYDEEALPLGPEADYSLGCPVLSPDDYVFGTYDLSNFTNQFDPAYNECDAPLTSGRDMVLSFYLAQHDYMWIAIHRTNLPLASSPILERPACFVDDCGLGTDTYVVTPVQIDGQTEVGLYAPETGWYYFIWDAEEFSWYYDHMHVHVDASAEPPTPPANDDCDGATTLPQGAFVIEDDLSDARNTFDPGRFGCSGNGGTGRDVVYRAPMATGMPLDVTMTPTGDWIAELYVITDCSDPMHTCVAGGETDSLGAVHLQFIAPEPDVYWLVCDSHRNGPRPFTLQGTLGSGTTAAPVFPATLSLTCTPNPFNPRATLAFTLPAACACRLDVYGLDGRRVRRLLDESRPAGRHEVVWDGRDDTGSAIASGAYLARLQAGAEVHSVRMLLLR